MGKFILALAVTIVLVIIVYVLIKIFIGKDDSEGYK